MKSAGIVARVAVLLLCSGPALAQGGVVLTPGGGSNGGTSGCVNSPENPTALLALVGTAGGLFTYARSRYRGRKGK